MDDIATIDGRTSADRADEGRTLLELAGFDAGDSDSVTDAITNLMHLCANEKWDFHRAMASAQMHFMAESGAPLDLDGDA